MPKEGWNHGFPRAEIVARTPYHRGRDGQPAHERRRRCAVRVVGRHLRARRRAVVPRARIGERPRGSARPAPRSHRWRWTARELQGVGKTIEEKIVQIVEDGEVHALTKHKQQVPAEVVEFMRIPDWGRRPFAGSGTSSASRRSKLKQAAESEQLRTLSGLGPRSEENVLKASPKKSVRPGLREHCSAWRCPPCWRRSRSFEPTLRRSRCRKLAAPGAGVRPSATSTSSRS